MTDPNYQPLLTVAQEDGCWVCGAEAEIEVEDLWFCSSCSDYLDEEYGVE